MAQGKRSKMSVREAGQKGGQKVKHLIEEGKRATAGMPRKRGKK